GSEENFQLLESLEVEEFVKYGLFDKQQKSSFGNKHGFAADQLFYNAEQDCYICPMGQRMELIGTFKQKTSSGFVQHIKKYRAKNCSLCPLNGACHKSKGNRIIQVNERLERHKTQAYIRLNSEVGREKRKRRCDVVEPVFANIKQYHGFRRFMLRGKEKVAIEWGLLAIAQN